MEFKQISDSIFGNCLHMTNGLLEMSVTLDFGPRIISLSLCGMENIFYQDKEKSVLGEMYDVYNGEQIKLYGGHRLWVSPEVVPRCYYPDILPVEYSVTDKGIEFSAPVERPANISKAFTVDLPEDEAIVRVRHCIRNYGLWDIELAPWAITMMAAGGVEIIPMPRRKTGYLPNRSISLWDYSDMSDARIRWGSNYLTLRQDPEIVSPFKLGCNNEDGWAAYFNKGQAFIKKFNTHLDGKYPDFGCSYETYTDGNMLEMETLGVLTALKPGASAALDEEWRIYRSDLPGEDESDIRKVIAGLL